MGFDLDLIYTQEQLFQKIILKHCPECNGETKNITQGEYKCTRCGKIFYDDYGRVKKYIEENGSASISQIARETGVPMCSVYNLVKYCKFRIIEPTTNYIKCEMCGTDLIDGQICPECGMTIKGKVTSVQDKIKLLNIGDKPKKQKVIFNGRTKSIESDKSSQLERLNELKNKSDSKLIMDLYEKKIKDSQKGV